MRSMLSLNSLSESLELYFYYIYILFYNLLAKEHKIIGWKSVKN